MSAVCLLLLERHVDVNGHDSKGDSPLLLAIRNRNLGAQIGNIMSAVSRVRTRF